MRPIPRTALLTVLALVASCGPDAPPGDEVAQADSTASIDSAEATVPVAPPTELEQRIDEAADSLTLEDPSATLDPDALGRGPLTALDSLRIRVEALSARYLIVVAENAELRATVAQLSNAPPRGSAGGTQAGPSQQSGTQGASGEQLIDRVQDVGQGVRNLGPKIMLTLVWLGLVALVIRGTVWVLDYLSETSAERRLFYKRLVPIARIFLWTIGVYVTLWLIFQVDTQGLLAAGAAVGVAIGFAAQDILKNVFGGLIVIFDQPFQVGDKISIAGTYGEVVGIGLRSTRIVTPDDNLVSVPNAQVVDGQVANANAGELNCQVVTHLHLPGWIDEQQAKRIAFEAAATSKYVYLKKPIVVIVTDEFKETFLTHIKVKAYVLDPRHEFLFMSDVTERARAGFREAGLLSAADDTRHRSLVEAEERTGGASGTRAERRW